MGIKKLFTFINDNKLYKLYSYLNDLIDDLGLEKKQTIIGIDGNLFCYKYSHSYDNMLIGFFNQILKFLSNGIIPLYIFDGGTLTEKTYTNYIRNYKKKINKIKLDEVTNKLDDDSDNEELLFLKNKLYKNTIKISISEINILLELLDLLNIPYIFGHGEGEYLAVLLNQLNIIDLFLSDDTDPIPAGIKKIIKFYNNTVYYLDIEDVYSKLELDNIQLCDMCILFGSDYATFQHGLKPLEIYNLIKEHNCIENMLDKINISQDDEFIQNINNIRNIYHNSSKYEKLLFINPNNSSDINYNIISSINNINKYSNIILEYWNDLINIMKIDVNDNININIKSKEFKINIITFISKHQFNIKNIIKFLKNNIQDISEDEIKNIINSFTYINKFSLFK